MISASDLGCQIVASVGEGKEKKTKNILPSPQRNKIYLFIGDNQSK